MHTKLLGWGLLGAVALTAALYLGGAIGPATGPVAPVAPVQTAPETVAAPAPAPAAPEADTIPGAPSETAAVESVAQPDTDAPAPPRFDLVRAEPGGQTLIAGSAAPGAEVTVVLDGAEQPSAPADGSGRFAQFLDLPPSPEPRVLRLRMVWQGQEIESEDEVILAPPAPPRPAADPAILADAPVPPPADAAPDTDAPAVAAAPAPDAGAPPETAAPAVLLSGAEGVEVLQPPTPAVPGEVVIDAISYDNAGGVTLSGRGSAASELRIYLDNRSVATARVPESGRWRAALPQVDSGTYTLRVDQIDAAGDVSARAESPFLREDPAKLAAASDAAAGPDAAPLRAVTVQPGHTLWALARDRYGEGTAYVKLFEANRDQIRDPDLIYPGQVFDMPD